MAVSYWSHNSPDGDCYGLSASELIAFHGSTPVAQATSANLSATQSWIALTGASLVANASITATFASAFLLSSTLFAGIFDSIQALRTCLKNKGLHSGGA